MARGYFITFEGLDGSGKSTQLSRLRDALTAAGFVVTVTRQPGGTALGDRIRGLLVDSKSEREVGAIAPAAEMALMFADRAQSLAEVILPAVARGEIVLCDRYTDSSEAYQGAGRGLGPERVREMHRVVCDNIQPELTVLLLPPLESSLARARRRNERHQRERGQADGRFEREGDAFYARVHEQYAAIASRDANRVVVFAEEASIEVIARRILEVVTARIAAAGCAPRAESTSSERRES